MMSRLWEHDKHDRWERRDEANDEQGEEAEGGRRAPGEQGQEPVEGLHPAVAAPEEGAGEGAAATAGREIRRRGDGMRGGG